MAKIFIDTNILIYTVDKKDSEKWAASREIIKKITNDYNPVISTQVLQEFFNALTTKLKIEKIVAKNIIHNFKNMELVNVDLFIIEQAIDICILFQISFWDSLIVAAAEQANCSSILSEDLRDGQRIRGIKIVNPFKNSLTTLI